MDAYQAYQTFIALQQHFTGESYNYFTYNGKTNTSQQSFMSNKTKWNYYKLVRKYTDLESFFLANFVYGDPQWIGDMMTDEADKNYKRWLKYNNAISRLFKEEFTYIFSLGAAADKVIDGQNSPLLTAVYQGKVSIETLLILDSMTPLLDQWNTKLIDPILWPKFYKKCKKYKPWIQKLNMDKFKTLAKEVINEQN